MSTSINNLVSVSSLLLTCSFLSSCSQERELEKSVDSKLAVSTDTIPERLPVHKTGWQLGLPGSRFEYDDSFQRQFIHSYREHGVDVFTKEFSDGVWYTWQKSFSTSFGIEMIRGRDSENYVIGGTDELTNETVIEGWRFTTPSGGLVAKRIPETSGPIGTPIPLTTPDLDLVGGLFIQPSERVLSSPPQKSVLYRGAGIHIGTFLVDPEGRFLIVQDSVTGGIYQLVNQQLVLLVDPQEYPNLLKFKSIDFYQYSNHDRILAVRTGGHPHKMIAIYDSENDGNFETISEMAIDEFNDTFPFYWTDDQVEPLYGFVY